MISSLWIWECIYQHLHCLIKCQVATVYFSWEEEDDYEKIYKRIICCLIPVSGVTVHKHGIEIDINMELTKWLEIKGKPWTSNFLCGICLAGTYKVKGKKTDFQIRCSNVWIARVDRFCSKIWIAIFTSKSWFFFSRCNARATFLVIFIENIMAEL